MRQSSPFSTIPDQPGFLGLLFLKLIHSSPPISACVPLIPFPFVLHHQISSTTALILTLWDHLSTSSLPANHCRLARPHCGFARHHSEALFRTRLTNPDYPFGLPLASPPDPTLPGPFNRPFALLDKGTSERPGTRLVWANSLVLTAKTHTPHVCPSRCPCHA